MKFYQTCSEKTLASRIRILTIEGYKVLEVSYDLANGLYSITSEKRE